MLRRRSILNLFTQAGSKCVLQQRSYTTEVHNSILAAARRDRPLDYPRFCINPKVHGKWITVKELHKYDVLQNGEKAEKDLVTLTGRIVSKRESSQKLVFYDIMQNGEKMQVVASQGKYHGSESKFSECTKHLRRGDIVSFTGVPGKTKHGQLSVFVTNEMKVLTPCLQDLPRKSLLDPEKRFRARHVDLLVNTESAHILRTRSRIIKFIREFLDARGFLEVETPILSDKAGGANARPFETHAFALNMDMQMRIAPELYLKQLVIGGLDRVYEIGKQFRNEGIDADHNPEFTTCEFYQAYGNLESLMNDTETLLKEMVQAICGGNTLQLKSGVNIKFDVPFRKIDVTEALEQQLGRSLSFLEKPDSISELLSVCVKQGLMPSSKITVPKLLDSLISEHIEPKCTQPTFLYNHPVSLSPLAKSFTDEKGRTVSARFELFVGGKEIVNAYEELNDPEEQRDRFRLQLQDRKNGDLEAPIPDTDFCNALEYGLPPTAGWGMGIDRVVQLLTGATHIREVLAFPTIRPRKPSLEKTKEDEQE
ncbi:hypothetical protein BDF20DRAFT_913599 [Mycotypha africana]|uniref:uncharacterized protein n=1 Tax=Mycotypha africana TaxID=64632 RepID=UPI002300475F|nr:uncharacterized protein BDF20DRAFT_913599 [Mycotypha africana]KAI8977251.1 hypothetical protein BDF20DRAFT_913599 [Mycotypha africana]